MKRKVPEPFLIDQIPQVRALAAPTRQEILDVLEISGPTTVATLGSMLGRAPDSLYHHIKILLGVGLIRNAETRSTSVAREAVYELAGRGMQIAYDLEDPGMVAAVNAVVRSMTRISYRDFERAADRGEAVVSGPGRNLRGARMKGQLDAAQIAEINRLYERITEIMNTAPGDVGAARHHAVTFLMAPLEGGSRAQATRSGREKRSK